MFLGLDLSLNSSGLCLLADTDHYVTTTAGSKTVYGVERLRLIIDALEEFTGGKDHCVTLAAIENYAMAGSGHLASLGELGGVVRYKLAEWNIPFIVVGIGQLKKFATNNGGADKVQMCEVARDAYGQDFLRPDNRKKPMAGWGTKEDHWRTDECDAYFLSNVAAMYAEEWDREPTTGQREVIQTIKLDPQAILSKAAHDRKKAKR